jgi:hypothetical protein
MKELRVLLKKEFWEQSRKAYTFIFLAFFPVVAGLQFSYIVKRTEPSIRNVIAPLLIDNLFTHYAIALFWIASFMFLQSAISKEKLTKSIEILLVTPLSPRKMWLGKSLYIWGWGMCAPILLVTVGLISIHTVIENPSEVVLPSSPAILFFFLILPFLCFVMIALNALLHLLFSHPTLLSMVYFFMGFLYFFLSTARARSFGFSWSALLISIIIILVLGGLLLALSKRLTRERIILGGK